MFCSVNHTTLNLSYYAANVELVVDVFHVICAPFTVLFNFAVLYILARYINVKSRLNQWFVVSMTVSDLMYALVYMATKLITNCFSRWLCRAYYIGTWSFQLMSVISLLLMNVDKFISLHYPLRYHQIVTERWVGVQLTTCWSVCVGFSVLCFAGVAVHFQDSSETECFVRRVEPWAYFIMLICFYIMPMLISLIISIYVFCVAQHLSNRLPGVTEGRVQCRRARQHLIKRVLFVFSSTMWTAVTMLPYRVFYLSILICREACGEQCNCTPGAFGTMVYIAWFLLPISTVVNPVITVVTQRIYRQHLDWLLGRFSWWAKMGADDWRTYNKSRWRSGGSRSQTVSDDYSLSTWPLSSTRHRGEFFEK